MKKEAKILVILCLLILLTLSVSAGIIKEDLSEKIKDKKLDEKIDVILQLKSKPKQADLDDFKRQGAIIKREFKYVKAIALKLPVKAVNALAQHALVEVIEPDYEIKTVLKESVPLIGADKVWSFNVKGEGVNVHVLDTGVSSPYISVKESVDFTGEGLQDLNGHGTHVAGTIASNNEQYKGVSPAANIYSVKVLDRYGVGFASDLTYGMEWSIDKRADIMSLSLGAQVENCDGTDILSLFINEARNYGVIPVVAAGNAGPERNTITTPGCARGALTVGAVDKSDVIAAFSSRGPTADGRNKPDIVAPGVSITSTLNDGSFRSFSGTSMATPHVSGTLALLISAGATKEEAESLLLNNAEDLGQIPDYQGRGRVNALGSYTAYLKTKEPAPVPTEPTPVTPPPSEPVPTEPTPTEPLPTEPEPSEPLPTEPSPTEPTPTEPVPTEPLPTEPSPTEPLPTEPTPEQPPSEPSQPIEEPTPEPSPDQPVEEPTKPEEPKKSFFGRAWEIINRLIPTKKARPREALERVVERFEEKKVFDDLKKSTPPGPVLIKEKGKPDVIILPKQKSMLIVPTPTRPIISRPELCGDNFCSPNEDEYICPRDCKRKETPPILIEPPEKIVPPISTDSPPEITEPINQDAVMPVEKKEKEEKLPVQLENNFKTEEIIEEFNNAIVAEEVDVIEKQRNDDEEKLRGRGRYKRNN